MVLAWVFPRWSMYSFLAVLVSILQCLLGGSLFWICLLYFVLLILWRRLQPSYLCFFWSCTHSFHGLPQWCHIFLLSFWEVRSILLVLCFFLLFHSGIGFHSFFSGSSIIILFLSFIVSISSSPDSINSASLDVDSCTICILSTMRPNSWLFFFCFFLL